MSGTKMPMTDRFGDEASHLHQVDGYPKLKSMIARASCRSFEETEVSPELLSLLCAAALSSPTKSDLQQRDIIVLNDPALRNEVVRRMSDQKWISGAPCLLVFCGNNRRQRRLHKLHDRPFVNDHLDAFFNAAVDASVALSAFVTAAEALGLGCCPISAIRNAPEKVSDLLGLPKYVFPVAGLAVGYPASGNPKISPRLPLDVTVHLDRYDEAQIDEEIEAYDTRRNKLSPYAQQRSVGRFGVSASYGWSEDKARQYAQQERQNFGQFIRDKGFVLS